MYKAENNKKLLNVYTDQVEMFREAVRLKPRPLAP